MKRPRNRGVALRRSRPSRVGINLSIRRERGFIDPEIRRFFAELERTKEATAATLRSIVRPGPSEPQMLEAVRAVAQPAGAGSIGLLELLQFDHPALRARGLDPETCRERGIGCVAAPGHLREGWLAIAVYDVAGRLAGWTFRRNEPAPAGAGLRRGRRSKRWAVSSELAVGRHLYNLDRAWPSIVRSQSAILVEGPFDALHLHRLGWTNCVALLGNQITGWHVDQLLTVGAETLVLLLDNDHGGRQGKRWALEIDGRLGQFQVVDLHRRLPRGRDPDELSAGELNEFLELYRPGLPSNELPTSHVIPECTREAQGAFRDPPAP